VSFDRYRVGPAGTLDLTAWDPGDTSEFPDLGKDTSRATLAALHKRLAELQHLLWADAGRAVLLILQAMDTGGKDGTIRKVFSGVNPQGVDVFGFGVPSHLELAHDYLWRIHARTPAKGRIAIHNRSHYEDVLVVRVEGLVPGERWAKRYDHIRAFEQLLVDEGTTIVKVYLNISKEEQRRRLQERLDDPTKRWKFNPGDLDARAKWDDYVAAYQDALARTSTAEAPWYVVPANRKWYRNLVVAQILVETLERMDLRYPDPPDLDGIVIA
jgi:PPK2 family polyphosphate:nucleotide phosphotransferase